MPASQQDLRDLLQRYRSLDFDFGIDAAQIKTLISLPDEDFAIAEQILAAFDKGSGMWVHFLDFNV
jgi:hypothetical protein